jgi:hypothetical protein
MWGDIVFVLVIMVAAVTIYNLIIGPDVMESVGVRTRMLTPVQVLQQKDADAFVNGPISPGPAALADKTAPYALLEYIPAYRNKSGVTTIGSQSCYARDSTNLRMKSSYAQMVNNYPHEYPDTCSGTRQEMILGVYQTPA